MITKKFNPIQSCLSMHSNQNQFVQQHCSVGNSHFFHYPFLFTSNKNTQNGYLKMYLNLKKVTKI